MAERLREQLERIQSNLERAKGMGQPIWPLNEADTERLVVEPVLRALGYDELDYRKRVQGVGANFPDYLVLPGSDQQWILEAKEWDTRLDERFERQAVNYASNNGAQWAVLTNGRTWWIYNTRAPGDLTQQRVYELKDVLDIDAALSILTYLSRASMQGGELDRAYRAREIRSSLVAELRSGNRQIVSVMRKVVGSTLDRQVSADDIHEALRSILPDDVLAEPMERLRPQSDAASTMAAPADGDWVTLAWLVEEPVRSTGSKPLQVRWRDSEAHTVQTWRDAAVAAIVHSRLLDLVPVPLRAGPRARRFFINYEPLHVDGRKMKGPRPVQWNGRVYYAEMHYSAHCLLVTLCWALQQAGLDPSSVEMQVGPGE